MEPPILPHDPSRQNRQKSTILRASSKPKEGFVVVLTKGLDSLTLLKLANSVSYPPMASSFITIASKPNFPSFTNQRLPCLRRNSLRINSVATKWEPTKVAPQADRVLIRLEDLPQKSAGGVLLPKSAVKFERYLIGEVLSVGSDVEAVEAGKKVLFSDINAYEVDLGTDAKHCFCRAGDLLAVVE
ncbi:hypothetical protein Syun_018775 [Stephania yunnanensis]|uniref:Chaperonin 10 n=1 Tax=Stephania yunnanensis TaxID=152371 RepID=A0AAP0IUF6_9MAGN